MTIRTESVKLSDAKLGDVIHFYGGRWLLTEVRFSAADAASRIARMEASKANPQYGRSAEAWAAEVQGEIDLTIGLRNIRGERIGNVEGHRCTLGQTWYFQSNDRYSWTREVVA